MHPAIPISLVFLGCGSNVVFLELLVKEVPSCGNIVTFFQFAFIAFIGFIFTAEFGNKKPVIPIRTYVTMVTLFFVTSVANNYALNFNLSLPLHMIFRAGSLMANLVLGVIILKKRYVWYQYLSVFMISVGIAIATIASSQYVGQGHEQVTDEEESVKKLAWEYIRWLIGISILTFALFMSARMGIYQETVYKKHGKHPSEALFYNHALPLPFFLIFTKDIYQHIVIFNQSGLVHVPLLSIAIPRLWLYLLGNILTQYICIKSVFILTTECTSLTVTLVVTLRKFMSLIFSIVYFKNPFTFWHGVGTTLVFGGTLLFTEVLIKIWNILSKKQKTA